MASRLPRVRSKLSQSTTPHDESRNSETGIDLLMEQMEQLLKEREEEKRDFLTVLKQVANNDTQIGQQATQIQRLNSIVISQKRQIEEMQESIIQNRRIRDLTVQRYKEEVFDPRPSFDPNNARWQATGRDGDALGDCCLYESGWRTDENVYLGLYSLLPREVRTLEDCEFLIQALSLRGTIQMDKTLSRGDKGNFAALVQRCYTGYRLTGRDNDAFLQNERMIELKGEVLKEFKSLQERSRKEYDRGVQMYHWRN